MRIPKEILILFVLLAFDVLVVYFHFRYGANIDFFNIDKEQSLNAIVSSTQFLLIGIFATLNAIIIYVLKSSWRRFVPWFLLGVGCMYFAIDDAFAIHEQIGIILNKIFHVGGFWGESFNWLIYFAPFLLIGAYIVYFVFRDIWKTSKIKALCIMVGLCFFIIALGLEYYEGRILVSASPPKLYHVLLLYEEFFELLGTTFMLVGIFSYVSKQVQHHIRLMP